MKISLLSHCLLYHNVGSSVTQSQSLSHHQRPQYKHQCNYCHHLTKHDRLKSIDCEVIPLPFIWFNWHWYADVAKAAQRLKESERSPSDKYNVYNKRPLDATTSQTGSSKSQPLKRDSRLGTYFEYDLSKMVNSKGGFLVEDGREVDEERIRKEKQRERERARRDQEPRMRSTLLYKFSRWPLYFSYCFRFRTVS